MFGDVVGFLGVYLSVIITDVHGLYGRSREITFYTRLEIPSKLDNNVV